MKKRLFGLIGLLTIGLRVTSCNFVDILSKKIRSITIKDSVSAYKLGDTFYNKCDLSIVAGYTDGRKVNLSKEDVEFELTLNSVSYDVKHAFTVAGNYSLIVKKDDAKSSKITISVFETEQYVSSISVSGASIVEQNRSIELSLTISPSKYTVDIECNNQSPTYLEVKRNNDTSYSVKGLAIGEGNLTFRAKKDALTYFSTTYHIEITESAKIQIRQNYKDYIDHNAYDTSCCPSSGDVKLLVIPIWLSDSDSYITESKKENIRTDLEKTYFGSTSETGWHSVSSYYEEESGGELHITGKVADWYTFDRTADAVSTYEGEKAALQKSLVKAATNWYFSNNPSDSRTNYDYDGDGYLDGVMLIYGAPDDQAYKKITGNTFTGGNLWAYCYWVEDTSLKNVTNPGVNAFFWASYDFMYSSGITANSRTGFNYGNGDTTYCTVDAHTYIHEMGHVFGLEDYYDYTKSTAPAAGFSMQDNNVGGHDPYSAMALGWADPYIPLNSTTLTINDFQSSHDLILLTPSWNSYDSPFDEYLLLELYTNTGLNHFDSIHKYDSSYPQGPTTVGIRLWHVDSRLFSQQTNDFMDGNAKSSSSLRFSLAFNNTYYNSDEDDKYGRDSFAYRPNQYSSSHNTIDYQRFNILHLIRQSTSTSYTNKNNLVASNLFYEGQSFNMNSYSSQFYKQNGKLNSGISLGWSFTVKNIKTNLDGTNSATIQLTRA